MNKKELNQVYHSLLDFYKEHNKIPLEVFAQETGLPEYKASFLLASFQEARPPPKKRVRKVKKVINTQESGYTVSFLKFMALPFSILAIILSSYFSIEFLSKQFPWILALGLSITIIGFGTFAFEATMLFAKRKSWVATIAFGLLWIGIVTYTIGTSTSSLYESYLMKTYNKNVTSTITNANRELFKSYEQALQEQLSLMDDKRQRLTIQQNVLKEFDSLEKQRENKASYQNAYWAASQLEKDITNISNKVSELRNLQQELLKLDSKIVLTEEMEQRPDIYNWLAKIFKTSSDYIQFILQVIPAAVLDIISPTALYLFLFLKKKEEK